jgi:hypothetical protein
MQQQGKTEGLRSVQGRPCGNEIRENQVGDRQLNQERTERDNGLEIDQSCWRYLQT